MVTSVRDAPWIGLLQGAYAERYTDIASKVIAKAIVIVALAEAGRQLIQVVTISIRWPLGWTG
jgi:hypothetical protein